MHASRGRHERPVGEGGTHPRSDTREAVTVGTLEPWREAPRGFDLVGRVARAQRVPELGPRGAELCDELVDDLPKRLRFARQGQEQMPIVDASAAEGSPRMADDFVAVREAHRVGADEEIDGVPAPAARDRVRAAGDGMRGVMTQLNGAHLPPVEGLGRGRARRLAHAPTRRCVPGRVRVAHRCELATRR